MAIYLKINDNERIEIKPTIFPDKTSQVWKVPGFEDIERDEKIPRDSQIYIYWLFEQEAEVIWLIQLLHLFVAVTAWGHMHLIIPYFPYARQDKPISNETCGSCFTFRCLLEPYLYPHTTLYLLDVHSEKSYEYFGKYMKTKIINHIPIDQIKLAMIGYDIMLLPDEGAFNRYKQVNPFQTTHCVKIRNQLTGAIESITIPDADFKDKRVLIVDDICDGGGTFIEIAKQLKEKGASRIGLHVSHGIFSKGMDVLHGAGINEIHCLSYEDFYQKVIDGEIK